MHPRICKSCLVLPVALVALAGCGSSSMVQVPPRVDLAGYRTVGLVHFSSKGADGLDQRASEEFLRAVQDAQPGVAVLELTADANGLMQPGTVNAEAIRELGRLHGVDAVVFGVVDVEPVKPRFRLGSLESLTATADVQGTLTARLLDTETGATTWSTIARGRQEAAQLSLSREGLADASAEHPDDARDRLLASLVSDATKDFRPGWVRVNR